MNNKKTILVIGGAGYIGSMLTRMLLDKGYNVRVFDKFLYGKESISGISNKNLEIVEGDTRHVKALADYIQGVDCVVYLAELVGDPMCQINPRKTLDINYLAISLIASACRHYKIKQFIYISSCSVYGSSGDDRLLNEESELTPLSLYAETKIKAESVLHDILGKSSSLTVLRLGTVFGWSHRLRFDLVVNLLTIKALTDKKITIFGGDQWRPNVHVKDVARAITTVLESPIAKVSGQTFNVGGEELNYKIMDLGKIVKKEVPQTDLVIDSKNVDKRNYRIDFSKIRGTLGFMPEYSVEYGVREIVQAFKDNPSLDYENVKFNNALFMKRYEDKI